MTVPDGVRLLQGVSIESVAISGRERFARVRLSVLPSTRGNVRVSGRHVYIDVTPPLPVGGAPPVAAPQVDTLVVVRPEGGDASALQAYRKSLDEALQRFEEIEPFLLSAVASPQADVLAAIGRTLHALGASVSANDVPVKAKDAHDLFTSAVEQVGRVVEPAFVGDRRAEALRAIAQFAEVKRRLNSES